jgi:hypothetical protein
LCVSTPAVRPRSGVPWGDGLGKDGWEMRGAQILSVPNAIERN